MDDRFSEWIRMVKNALIQPFFIMAFLLYMSVYFARFVGFILPEIINSYLTDILCMPLVLSLSCLIVRRIKMDPMIKLTFGQIMGMTIFYAWYFEWFLPQRSISYTADWVDVICYFLGSIIFWLKIQPHYLRANCVHKH